MRIGMRAAVAILKGGEYQIWERGDEVSGDAEARSINAHGCILDQLLTVRESRNMAAGQRRDAVRRRAVADF